MKQDVLKPSRRSSEKKLERNRSAKSNRRSFAIEFSSTSVRCQIFYYFRKGRLKSWLYNGTNVRVLTETVVMDEQIQNFINIRASLKSLQLRTAMKAYDESRARFLKPRRTVRLNTV